jgi:glycosyltransferase involved in cell wall biosynthesis
MAKLAKYLPRTGWSVTVVCADVRRPEVHDASLLAEIPEAVEIARVGSPLSTATDRAAGTAMAAYRSGRRRWFLRPLVALGRALLLPDRWILWSLRAGAFTPTIRPQVVVSSGPPHSTHLAGARLARRFDASHVIDIRDGWGDDPMGLHVVPWQRWVDSALERRLLPHASAIVTVSHDQAGSITSRFGALAERVRVIPNGFDPEDLRGISPRIPATGDKITFLYAGRLVAGQQLGMFFEVLGGMIDEALDPSFRFLGAIDPAHAEEASAHLGSRVAVDRPVSHGEALAAMGSADVLVVASGGGGTGTGKGKLFEYLASGRPVLTIGPAGPGADLLRATRAGAWAPEDDRDAIRAAIGTVVAMARDPSFAGAPPGLLEPFTRSHLAIEWSHLLEEVAGVSPTVG